METGNEQSLIDREEFAQWKELNVSKKIIAEMEQIRESLKEGLATGMTLHRDAEVSTDMAVGQVRGLDFFLKVEDFMVEQPRIPFGE